MKMKKKINEVKRKLNIPLSLEQEGLKVEFRKWFGRNGENRFELIGFSRYLQPITDIDFLTKDSI